ncbi:MAG: endonuclease/exonuclease/phosphatase family protein [Acidobacteriota bacterium]
MIVLASLPGCTPYPGDEGISVASETIRVATFNIEDVRTGELLDPESVRLRAAAALIQRLQPDILVLNEIPYNQPGDPDWQSDQRAGDNAQRFCDAFLARSQGEGLEPLEMKAFTAPVNTGVASGFDLDNDGAIHSEVPPLPPVGEDPRTPEGIAYAGDAWGFGTYPGHYAMALLVSSDLKVARSDVRTFQQFLWSRMPGALIPVDPDSGATWYSEQEWASMRLASKSFWDVPVILPSGQRIRFLLSHPTPPAFDGPEQRNRARNHDEIRFWADYLNDAQYIVDDDGVAGGLEKDELFVIAGDLNSDPDEGLSLGNPIDGFLLKHPRIQGDFVPSVSPQEEGSSDGVDPDDTSSWGMRVDYVLPSIGFEIVGGGVWRPGGGVKISDHYLVYVDLKIPNKVH